MSCNQNQLCDNLSSLNHISLNSPELFTLATHYFEEYCKSNHLSMEQCCPLWQKKPFLEEVKNCSRGSLVLSLLAISLDREVNYEDILNEGLNNSEEIERLNILKKSIDAQLYKKVLKFLVFLRKQIFSYTFSQNKNLTEITDLSPQLLKERYQLFMKASEKILNI